MVKYAQISDRNKRRYYLHRRLSPSVHRLVPHLKTVYATQDMIDTLTKGQQRNLDELKRKFQYALQLIIPE